MVNALEALRRRLTLWRHLFCFLQGMQLFESLQDGFDAPLTSAQVAGLFDAGCLGRNTGCNSSPRTVEQTIDDLLPLLKYRTSRHFTRHLPTPRRPCPFRLSLPTAIPLVFLGAIATVAIGLVFSTTPSVASPIPTRVASRAVFSSSVVTKKQTKSATLRSGNTSKSRPVASPVW
jgi:hypothetical protein